MIIELVLSSETSITPRTHEWSCLSMSENMLEEKIRVRHIVSMYYVLFYILTSCKALVLLKFERPQSSHLRTGDKGAPSPESEDKEPSRLLMLAAMIPLCPMGAT